MLAGVLGLITFLLVMSRVRVFVVFFVVSKGLDL